MKIYINGKFYPEKEAKISVFDHGFLYGDGVYETLRTYNGQLFRYADHYRRLSNSAKLISLKLPIKQKEMQQVIETAIQKNGLKEARIRVSISRGSGKVGLDTSLCPKPTIVIMATEFKPMPAELYRKGVKLIVAETIRNHSQAINPAIKSTNFLNNILAKIEARKAKAFDAIMLNWQGYVAETTIANLFIIKDGKLLTPPLEVGILNGITRQMVINCAEKLKIPFKEKPFKAKELLEADECFLTNTSGEVIPVSKIGNKSFPIGKITKELHLCFRRMLLCPPEQTEKFGFFLSIIIYIKAAICLIPAQMKMK
ncbi:MAG: aminodeoxychorismate lyase [Candidatus Margulisiibacteriota bacterium]